MKKRVQALDVLINRLREYSDEHGIKTLKLNPNTEIYEADMPAIILISGRDVIIKEASNNARGIPMVRSFTITAELIVNRKDDNRDLVKAICDMRDIVLGNPYPLKLDNGKPDATTYFKELGTDGPYSYRVAYIEGMQFIIELRYKDDGTY